MSCCGRKAFTRMTLPATLPKDTSECVGKLLSVSTELLVVFARFLHAFEVASLLVLLLLKTNCKIGESLRSFEPKLAPQPPWRSYPAWQAVMTSLHFGQCKYPSTF